MANSKGSSKQNASDDVKEEINSIKRETEPKNDDDDSENDLPLSARKKGNSNSVNQVVFLLTESIKWLLHLNVSKLKIQMMIKSLYPQSFQ